MATLDTNNSPKNILGQLIKNGLNPIQESALKAVQKKQSEQINQAMESGVPAQHILKQLGIPLSEQEAVQQISSTSNPTQLVGDSRNKFNQAMAGQPPIELPKERSILGGLIRQTPRQRSIELNNKILEQQITGQTPLQTKDINEAVLKSQLKTIEDMSKDGTLTANNIFTKFEPIANNFQEIIDSYARIQASAENPSPAGDLALIFNYMKLLDPDSVVREGEFATAQNSASIPERVRNLYNSFISGERLGFKDSSQRKDFVDRAKRLYISKENQYRDSEKKFKALAKKNGIDPERVLRKVEFISSKSKKQSDESLSDAEKEIRSMSDEELKRIAEGL